MPKKYGVKEKDQVVAHILNLVLTGRLRSGNRVDRNEIAADLGLSRVPIQEAIVQLEHDGILATRYHRGAFVERFDEAVLHEHHDLYGLLNGLASARAAADPTPQLLDQLDELLAAMRAAKDARAFREVAWEYRRLINAAYAGPRLLAVIRASQRLVPPTFWETYMEDPDQVLPFYEDETAAIYRRAPEAARAACVGRADLMAQLMLSELRRRRVFAAVTDGNTHTATF